MVNSVKKCVYLDYAAATPVRNEVFAKMLPYFSEKFGNPSAIYEFAQEGRRAIDLARRDIGTAIGCSPREVLFTGSGTESDNLAIKGVAQAYKRLGKHIVTTKIEHHAVLNACKFLETEGYEVTYLETDSMGVVDPKKLKKALRPETILVSIIYGNNEIGTVQDIAALAKVVQKYKAENHEDSYGPPFFHTDACQAVGSQDINVQALCVDLMTINGGKIYGPKGVGALYVKKNIHLQPQIIGGGQEYRQRAGTENTPAIIGMAEALRCAQQEREKEIKRLRGLRDNLIQGIQQKIPKTKLNGHPTRRLPNNVNVSFEGIEGETILLRLDMEGVCASSGSACTSGKVDASHVLLSIGVPYELAHGSVRFTLGKDTTQKDIDYVLEKLPKIVEDLRGVSPLYTE